MKKVFIAAVMLSATFALHAQQPVYRIETTESNPAYVVPDYIRTDFETTNPTITTVTWAPVNSMWRATYKDQNRITQVYYINTGEAFRVALPVISTQVPEEVVTAAIEQYGTSLYDITKMKAADNSDVYQVRLLENNTPRSIYMNDQGVQVTNGIYKVKVEDDKVKVKEDDKNKMKMENQ